LRFWFRGRQGNLSASYCPFTKQAFIGEQLKTIFAGMLKNNSHQVYRDCDYLPDIFEIHRLALLENNPVLVFGIDQPDFHPGIAVTIGHFAEENELVVPNWKFLGVNGLHYIYDARHP
jgi:hypothetical protein